jgi:carbonic anhydrase
MSVTDELSGTTRSTRRRSTRGIFRFHRQRRWPWWRTWTPASTSTRSGPSRGRRSYHSHAGGVVTDDEIRSLTISQPLLGTEEIVLIHHTDCGMLTFSDADVNRQIQNDTGIKPPFALEAFGDLEEDVRQSIARIKASPFVPNKDSVRGFVYEVETGRLREVS